VDATWALLPPLMQLAARPRLVALLALAPVALASAALLAGRSRGRRCRSRPRRDRRLALLPIAAWALAVAVAPLVGPAASGRVVWVLSSMPAAEGRSNAVLLWGEVACAHADIPVALGQAQALPADLQAGFMDGCAHRLRLDVSDPAAAAARIVATVPQRWQLYVHEAALRRLAADADLQPDAVLARTADYVAAAPGLDPRNAVRTELQWTLGDDLQDALTLALRYPPDWQPAMLEELGWRAGDQRTGSEAAALAEGLPDDVRCSFVRGAVRGRVLRQPDGTPWTWAQLDAWRAPLPGCAGDQAKGIAWAFQIQQGGDRSGIEASIAAIADPALRRAVEQAAETLPGPSRPGLTTTLWE